MTMDDEYNRKRKKFTGNYGSTLEVSRNHENYDQPASAVYLRGKLGNMTISRDDALELAEHLKELVAGFDALKPKEKTVVEKVAELEPGTVFTAGREHSPSSTEWT